MRDMIHEGTQKVACACAKTGARKYGQRRRRSGRRGSDIGSVGTKRQRDRRLRTVSGGSANYDTIQTMTEAQIADFSGIVFDELTRLKNPRGKRFKALEKKISGRYTVGVNRFFYLKWLEDVLGSAGY